MSQPPSPYDRQYNFTDFQSVNPSTPLPGQKVDQELNAVRSTLNATISRLGEVQADDGKVRNSALNLTTIAEAVEPLLTTAPVTAVNAAGAVQVAAVNAAGTTQVAAVNASGAAKLAALNAAINSESARTAIDASRYAASYAAQAETHRTDSQTAAQSAHASAQEAFNRADIAYSSMAHALEYSANAGGAAAAASSFSTLAQSAYSSAASSAADANASKMAALDAKGDAEAAANAATSAANNAGAIIVDNVQDLLDEAEAFATSAHDSANDALTSKTAAASSASAASVSAGSADTSAIAALASAGAAASSAAAAAVSAGTINPASFAPAVHTHTIANVTSLQTALDGKQASGSYASSVHSHVISDVTNLQTFLDGKAASTHTHTIANVTGLQTAIDGKAASSHVHVISNVTGLQNALDAKISDAPSDGSQYARKNGAWDVVSSGGAYLPLSGGAMTGDSTITNGSYVSYLSAGFLGTQNGFDYGYVEPNSLKAEHRETLTTGTDTYTTTVTGQQTSFAFSGYDNLGLRSGSGSINFNAISLSYTSSSLSRSSLLSGDGVSGTTTNYGTSTSWGLSGNGLAWNNGSVYGEFNSSGIRFPDGSVQSTAAYYSPPGWSYNFGQIASDLTLGATSVALASPAPTAGNVLGFNGSYLQWTSVPTAPPYSDSVWVYGNWYSATIKTVYDTSYNYVNVLTF